jgi:hypothetical protein
MSYIIDKLDEKELKKCLLSSDEEEDSKSTTVSLKSMKTINSSEYSDISNIDDGSCNFDYLRYSGAISKNIDRNRMLYHRFNPFVSNDKKNQRNPELYELKYIGASQDNIHKYFAVVANKNGKNYVDVFFGPIYGDIYKDRTIYKLYHHKEKLNKLQADKYYENHKKKINKKFTSHYFEYYLLMITDENKFNEFKQKYISAFENRI